MHSIIQKSDRNGKASAKHKRELVHGTHQVGAMGVFHVPFRDMDDVVARARARRTAP